jgi:predicted LPLAT superfamily acyltransferase
MSEGPGVGFLRQMRPYFRQVAGLLVIGSLAGIDPLTAIRYQIVVMYMLLAAAARLAERALFDDAHRLRPLPAAAGQGTR